MRRTENRQEFMSESERSREAIEAALRGYLAAPGYRPETQRSLIHRLHLSPDERPLARGIVAEGLRQGWLVRRGGGRLALAESAIVVGMLRRDARGNGWLPAPDGSGSIRIPADQLEGTLSGDCVRVKRDHRGRGGRLIAVEQARDRRIPGVLQARGRQYRLRPFDDRLEPMQVARVERGLAQDGDVVLARIERTPEGERAGEAVVVERWGRLGEPAVAVRVVAWRHDLPMRWPAAVEREVEALPSRIGPAHKRGRERFDDPAPVTIDGETSRDFDDAFSVQRIRGGYRLIVHIADVAHFVPPDSALDREARRRGTSVYFPDRVLPMFPEALSNELCSLKPNVDRLVQSAVLDIDTEGEVRKARFVDGVIRSAARLTYGEVGDWLDGKAAGRGIPGTVRPMLEQAAALCDVLEQRRRSRGAIDFDLPQPVLLLDVEGAMTGVRIEERNRAHRMIEAFMLAANEAVATHLRPTPFACVYRAHDPPDPAKLDDLESTAKALGLRWRLPKGKLHPRHLSALVQEVGDGPAAALINQLSLRAMKAARYRVEPGQGHFALALANYCHFTSPIRRYPDLLVHRMLRASTGGAAVAPPDAASAEHASKRERAAEAAERELLHWKKVEFMQERVGQQFEGQVTAIAPFGVFVQIDAWAVDGLIRTEVLGDETWEVDAVRHRLLGASSGRVLQIGDRFDVRVDRVDPVLRRIDLSPAQPLPRAQAKASRPRRRRRRS